MVKLHNVTQGSAEWNALRARCRTASEAPAMMGASKYKSRTALLAQKSTGISEEVSAAQQALFNRGHETEAAARPLVEAMIGEELYPATATDDAEYLLASSDGATMLGTIGFEHKLWNEKLADQVRAGELEPTYYWQLEQQALVFGFEKIIFVTSDGTAENFEYMEYAPIPGRAEQLLAGWKQFDEDLKTFQPSAVEVKAEGKAPETLPALRIEVTGMVTASNLEQFKTAALTVFRGINTSLQTDQDFADAEKAVKFCKDAEERLEAAKSHALSQTESIDALFKTIDAIKEEARAVRLKLDKLVKAEKENRKGEIITKARHDLVEHVDTLHKRIGFACISIDSGIFAAAISGLKSLDSMREKVSVALANAKVEANAVSDRVWANHATVEDMTLFPDFAQVCTKAPDDFAALMAMRISQRKEADEKRLAAEREKIRIDEERRANILAAEQAATERRAAEQEMQKAAPAVQPPVASNDCLTTIKLGEICTRLGFTVTADFLASLGVSPVATDKNAKLYDANKFPTICRLISEHVMALAFKKAA